MQYIQAAWDILASVGTEAQRQKHTGVPAAKAPGLGQEKPTWEPSLLLGVSKEKKVATSMSLSP